MKGRQDRRWGPGTPFRDRDEYERYCAGEFDPRYPNDRYSGIWISAVYAVAAALSFILGIRLFTGG